ncbi:hypothetical protein [Bdellovibrio svalbardensis]|uniref:Response regulatory domain-containing protein n=1 Tax=Bdellovibrio svalbardensis TaxID=2972972 RepID=A0ABT6DLT2_9BACT|nr:hypothetical protein [Bdellovibrio svalbardensis]MDG0817840.1 hypothetical protein [Bdellovibrio svalbardensis]
MEQDSQQRRSILIIKSHVQGLGPAEGFLKNRGWDIKATANLKEALIYLVQKQPQFVMISIDHPNRKVRNLPKVLAQAFPVCVIAFSETASAANIKILTDSAAQYAIFPPITGPAIERTINKYYKDQQIKSGPGGRHKDSSWEKGRDDQQSSMIAIKGQNTVSAETARNFLAQFLGGDGGETMTAVASHPTGADLSHGLPGTNNGGMASSSSTEGSGYYSNPNVASDDDPFAEYTPRKNKSDSPGWAPIAQKEKAKGRPGSELVDGDVSSLNSDSLIAKGAHEALEKSCINFQDKVTELEKATNVVCIMVESARFSGYLIAAMAKDKTMDLVFIERVRSRLFRFLKDNGEKVEDSESMPVKVREVPFEDWALAHAEFLRKSVHNGEEIAMAFFPRKDLKAKLIECADSEMAAIHIDELAADVRVEFNVYIHLPRNNKYLLYTPSGSTFMGTQKDRLVNQGVSHLHILRLEQSGLDKYRAQNFLNDKIEEFEAKDPNKVIA